MDLHFMVFLPAFLNCPNKIDLSEHLVFKLTVSNKVYACSNTCHFRGMVTLDQQLLQ